MPKFSIFRQFIDVSLLQLKNTPSESLLINVDTVGISTYSSSVQLKNALKRISVAPLRQTEDKLVQSLKE